MGGSVECRNGGNVRCSWVVVSRDSTPLDRTPSGHGPCSFLQRSDPFPGHGPSSDRATAGVGLSSEVSEVARLSSSLIKMVLW